MLERFWLAFIPLFVAVDAIGVVALFWGMAEGLTSEHRQQAIHQAALVAWLVGLTFLVISGWVWRGLGISMADVLIAGGLILFALALNDMLRTEKVRYTSGQEFGAVPLGVPILVGPAVLTTLLLVRERYGVWMTAIAFNLNILIAWGLLLGAERVVHLMGRDGAKVFSKVLQLVLAAFAVMLVRQGLTYWLR